MRAPRMLCPAARAPRANRKVIRSTSAPRESSRARPHPYAALVDTRDQPGRNRRCGDRCQQEKRALREFERRIADGPEHEQAHRNRKAEEQGPARAHMGGLRGGAPAATGISVPGPRAGRKWHLVARTARWEVGECKLTGRRGAPYNTHQPNVWSSPGGGIGRRASLRGWWPSGRAGSSPA
jgi:hypothetical protein